MNLGYINPSSKQSFLLRKTKIYQFDNSNKLYIFYPFKKPPKIIKKHNIKIIDEYSESIYKKSVYMKTILQILKEKNINELSFCFENAEDYLFILEEIFKKNIPFSLTDCTSAENVTDYFLEKYGHPITITRRIKSGLLVYIGGTPPMCDSGVFKLDLTKKLPGNKIIISEFLIKNRIFPIKITSFGLLDAALKLTESDTEDIIIKHSIICHQEE